MQHQKTAVPFRGTREQREELLRVIEALKDEKGALMPIMQQAQEIYGYLPMQVQTLIAKGLGIPIEEVYQVATFYSQFTLSPKGKTRISICLGTACYVKGAGDILQRITQLTGIENGQTSEDGVFSLDACRCIGACGLAPVVMINDDVYGRVKTEDIEGILDKYRE